MNPQTDQTPVLGLPQPSNTMAPLPPIHAPQTFRAPDSPATHFSAAAPSLPNAPTVNLPQSQSSQPPQTAPAGAIQVTPQSSMPNAATTLNQINAMATTTSQAVNQPEESDTPLDEEWIAKAHVVVGQTHNDPYIQSRELSKLKAQYIKARYNKDIKVSER